MPSQSNARKSITVSLKDLELLYKAIGMLNGYYSGDDEYDMSHAESLEKRIEGHIKSINIYKHAL